MSPRFKKIYVEISNICNLSCAFCPKTNRAPRRMNEEEFSALLPKLKPYTDFLYFHIMGEPLCHPKLESFLSIASEAGFRVIITTNGTLLKDKGEILLRSDALHKVNVSLHAFEANDLSVPLDDYLDGCFEFGKRAESEKKTIIVYRLWNEGGADALNGDIKARLERYFPAPWQKKRNGVRIGECVYLEHGDKFDWPDLEAPLYSDRVFCYGLRDQLGILSDGTVVPCCLDHNGDIALGNALGEDIEDILNSERARKIYDGFTSRHAAEELCRRCGYASRFEK